MSAPVTITEMTYALVPPGDVDIAYMAHRRYDTAEEAREERYALHVPYWRIIRVDATYTITPLDDPAGEGGGDG